jgi:hypothetical protein
MESNDQAAYAITPVPSCHTMFIGDIREPTYAVDLLNYQDWNEALKLMRHSTLTEKINIPSTVPEEDDTNSESMNNRTIQTSTPTEQVDNSFPK